MVVNISKVVFLLLIIVLASCEKDDGIIIAPFERPFRTIDTEPDWSPDGRLISYTHLAQSDSEFQQGFYQIWLLDLETMSQTFLTTGFASTWSPDGKKIAYVKNNDIYVIDTETKKISQFTNWGSCFSPSWSPDGEKIAYEVTTNWPIIPVDSAGIWIMKNDGTNRKLVLSGRMPAWSPDGAIFVYAGSPGISLGTENQIWVASIDGSNKRQLTWLNISNRDPSWSPDGSKIAWGSYGQGDSPSSGIWVMNSDGTNQLQLTRWGGYPSWSPDGSKIVYYQTNPDSITGSLWLMNSNGTDQQQLTRP